MKPSYTTQMYLGIAIAAYCFLQQVPVFILEALLLQDAAECIVADRVTEPPFPVRPLAAELDRKKAVHGFAFGELRFTVGYGDAKFLDFLEDWTLKDNKFCQGETACDVFISPSFSGQNSTVLITAKASCTKLHQQQLFLCPKTGTPRLSTPCIVPSSVKDRDSKICSPRSRRPRLVTCSSHCGMKPAVFGAQAVLLEMVTPKNENHQNRGVQPCFCLVWGGLGWVQAVLRAHIWER